MLVGIINWLKDLIHSLNLRPSIFRSFPILNKKSISFFSPCSGLVVTSYNKYKYDIDTRRKIERKIYSSFGQYTQFKKIYEINAEYEGELKEQSFKTNILL